MLTARKEPLKEPATAAIKAGAKRDDFLIDKAAKKARKVSKRRRKAKR
jgi:hypothetical protein